VKNLKVELKNISKVYKMGETQINAINCVDLLIKEGDLLTIMGPSGSGKTTLLNIIGVLDRPSNGELLIDGRNVSHLSEMGRSRIRLKKYGFIFQQFYPISSRTAKQNVYLPIREASGFSSGGKSKAQKLLEMVGMGDRSDHLPTQLSGGEQQRVAIARALANDPEMILADEPTGELDSENSKLIIDLLRDLNREQDRSVVIVTHDPEIARRSKRTVKMKDGTISK
jgi:putative ABC transport system ATP-binding protein